MGDLISRKAVIELLKNNVSNDIEEVIVTDKNIKLIESMPCVYDVEKVVEQEENFLVNFGVPKDTKVHRKIIDIVKRGGVE